MSLEKHSDPTPVVPEQAVPLRKTVVAFLILAAAGLLAYSSGLNGEFQMDDGLTIAGNHAVQIGSPERIWKAAKTRFIPFMTFALNAKLHGMNVFGFHLTNLIFHILAAFLVYWLCRFLFLTPKIKNVSARLPQHDVALFAALIFLLHPVQTQAVTYLSQRIAVLAALFYVGTVVLYLYSRLRGSPAAYGASLASCALAVMSKENAFTLPVAIVLTEGVFFGFSKKTAVRQACRFLPFFLIIAVLPDFFLLRRLFFHEYQSWMPENLKTGTPAISRWQYLFTQFRVVCTYIRLLFVPANQMVDYDFPLSGSFWEPATLAAFVLLSLIFTAGFMLLRNRKILGFGILWFFLTLSVESSIFPVPDVIFEHRLYLPMAGAAVFIACGAFEFLSNPRHYRTGFILIAVLLSGLTFARNGVWRTNVSLWADNAEKAPEKGRVLNNLGDAYSRRGMRKEGFRYFEKAAQVDPDYALSYLNMAAFFRNTNEPERAEKYYRIAVEKAPGDPVPLYHLANFYGGRGEPDKAIPLLQKILTIRPDSPHVLNNLGVEYVARNDVEKAAEYFRSASRMEPYFVKPYYNLGLLDCFRSLWPDASEQLLKAVEYDPYFFEAEFLLGYARFRMGSLEEARSHVAALRRAGQEALAGELEGLLSAAPGAKDPLPKKRYFKRS